MVAHSNDDDDRERLSWREIDRRRDKSRHGRQETKTTEGRRREEKIRQDALKQVEALFAGKQQRPEYKKALAALEDLRATPEFNAVAEKFILQHGLPEEWHGLMLFLDYADPGVVVAALGRLQDLAPSRSVLELQGLKGKLRTLSLTSRYPEVKERAADMLQTF